MLITNSYAKMEKHIVYGTYHDLFLHLDEYLDRKDRTVWYRNFGDFDKMREDLKRQTCVLTNIFSDCVLKEKESALPKILKRHQFTREMNACQGQCLHMLFKYRYYFPTIPTFAEKYSIPFLDIVMYTLLVRIRKIYRSYRSSAREKSDFDTSVVNVLKRYIDYYEKMLIVLRQYHRNNNNDMCKYIADNNYLTFISSKRLRELNKPTTHDSAVRTEESVDAFLATFTKQSVTPDLASGLNRLIEASQTIELLYVNITEIKNEKVVIVRKLIYEVLLEGLKSGRGKFVIDGKCARFLFVTVTIFDDNEIKTVEILDDNETCSSFRPGFHTNQIELDLSHVNVIKVMGVSSYIMPTLIHRVILESAQPGCEEVKFNLFSMATLEDSKLEFKFVLNDNGIRNTLLINAIQRKPDSTLHCFATRIFGRDIQLIADGKINGPSYVDTIIFKDGVPIYCKILMCDVYNEFDVIQVAYRDGSVKAFHILRQEIKNIMAGKYGDVLLIKQMLMRVNDGTSAVNVLFDRTENQCVL